METVLAIDPGERVGWAIADLDADGEGFEVVRQGVSHLRDFAMKLGKSYDKYDTVIYETWRLYPEMGKKLVGNDMQPSQLIGIIRYLSWCNPQVKLVSQGANIKKTALKTMPNTIGERLQRSSEQHDQDAVMHAWHYFWSTRIARSNQPARRRRARGTERT